MSAELGSQTDGVPVLPCFGEHAIVDAHEGGTRDFYRLARGCLAEPRRPVHADKITFSEGNDWSEAEVGEVGTQAVIKMAKFVRPDSFAAPSYRWLPSGKSSKMVSRRP